MAELAGKEVVIKISGSALSLTDEATSTTDNTIYQVTDATKQVLNRDASFTVYDGGITTSESYELDYLQGTITFGSVDNTRVITISGEYLPMATAAYANSMSRAKDCNLIEKPRFGQTHMERIAGQKSAAGTLTQINITDTTYIDALVAGNAVVIENAPSSSDDPERYWAFIESSEMSAAIAGVQEEVVTWTSTDEWS